MRLLVALFGLGALSCASSGNPPRQHAQLEHIGYDAPRDWSHTDVRERGVVVTTWTPEDNARRESLTVIRSERGAAVAKAGPPALERLLARAQPPGAHASAPQPLTTHEGLIGARIELDFVPAGLKASYHRVHAVVVDGSAIVNVFYTARSPEADLEAFNLVLDSIHHEES